MGGQAEKGRKGKGGGKKGKSSSAKPAGKGGVGAFKEAKLHEPTASVSPGKGAGAKGGGPGGRGKGAGAAPPSAEKVAAAAPADDGPVDEDSKVTKALVEALRAFSSPQWWLVAEEASASVGAGVARRRLKPEEFQQRCEERHTQMRKVYESTMSQDSEQRWLRKVSSEGTSGDRVASLTMLIQICPVFATPYIKALLNMAAKTARSDSIMALDALKDLFVSTLLPDRKLKTFVQMEPLSPKGLGKVQWTQLSVVAFFEDFLKTAFASFVHVLSDAAHSSVVFFKSKALRTAAELLSAKPEQERALLQLLVNKFGDHASKVSSNVSFQLKSVLKAHPAMKLVVVKEVEAFLSRKNLTQNSVYVAVLFLSEMMLIRRADSDVAAELIRVFVSRLEQALQGPVPASQKDRGPRLVKMPGGRTRWARPKPKKKARRGVLADDDNRLVRTLINGIQRVMPYLDATVSSAPLQDETINALFKVCHTVSAFSTRIAILSLLNRCLFETAGKAPDRFYRLVHEQVAQFELFGCSHRHQAFLLMQRILPADTSVARAVAMCRRMLQVGANSAPTVAVAALSVLGGLLVARRAELRPLLQSCESELRGQLDAGADDDADEERFVDDDAVEALKKGQAAGVEDEEGKFRYLPFARDPLYAKARGTPMWELYALKSHVHPFVAHGAAKLLQAEAPKDLGGSPFEVFSQQELLQQFVLSSRSALKGKQGKKGKEAKARVSYLTERFSAKAKVLPHEEFLQLYFRDSVVQTQRRLKDEKRKQKEEDVDEEGRASGGDDEDEEADKFFDDYMKGQLPADPDDEGEEEDPDMDDDSEVDAGSDDDDDDDAEGGGESDASDGGGDDEEPEQSSGDEAAGTRRRGAGKRKAGEALTSAEQKKKRLKAAKGAASMFASAEDYADLLAEDDGGE